MSVISATNCLSSGFSSSVNGKLRRSMPQALVNGQYLHSWPPAIQPSGGMRSSVVSVMITVARQCAAS